MALLVLGRKSKCERAREKETNRLRLSRQLGGDNAHLTRCNLFVFVVQFGETWRGIVVLKCAGVLSVAIPTGANQKRERERALKAKLIYPFASRSLLSEEVSG